MTSGIHTYALHTVNLSSQRRSKQKCGAKEFNETLKLAWRTYIEIVAQLHVLSAHLSRLRKHFCDANVLLRRRQEVLCAYLSRILHADLLGHSLFSFGVITFGAYDEFDDVWISIILEFLLPVLQVIKRLIVCDGVHKKDYCRSLVIQLVDRAILLRPRSVPQLQLHFGRRTPLRLHLENFRGECCCQGRCLYRKVIVNVPFYYACLADRTVSDQTDFEGDCLGIVRVAEGSSLCHLIYVVSVYALTVASLAYIT